MYIIVYKIQRTVWPNSVTHPTNFHFIYFSIFRQYLCEYFRCESSHHQFSHTFIHELMTDFWCNIHNVYTSHTICKHLYRSVVVAIGLNYRGYASLRKNNMENVYNWRQTFCLPVLPGNSVCDVCVFIYNIYVSVVCSNNSENINFPIPGHILCERGRTYIT